MKTRFPVIFLLIVFTSCHSAKRISESQAKFYDCLTLEFRESLKILSASFEEFLSANMEEKNLEALLTDFSNLELPKRENFGADHQELYDYLMLHNFESCIRIRA